jgi:hypothetical protein
MAANEQHAVPVWDGRADRYCGTLTPTDLLQLLLMCSDTKEHASCLQVCCLDAAIYIYVCVCVCIYMYVCVCVYIYKEHASCLQVCC